MTKAQDIRQLIAEQAAEPSERRAMEHVAEGLERSLAKDVPARPEFKAQLRRQLMAQARKNASPWYKRPAVWGSTLGVAAAAAVLAVGLNMFQATAPGQVPGTKTGPTPNVVVDPNGPKSVVPGLTSALKDVTLPVLDDQAIPAGSRPETGAPDVAQGLTPLVLTGSPDQQFLSDMAGRLGFTAQVVKSGDTFRVSQNGRSLSLSADLKLVYGEDLPLEPPPGATAGDAEVARAAARRFLQDAGLPAPDLQPVVAELSGRPGYAVTFTPRVEGRPVVNGQTLVVVTAGRVVQATMYAPTGQSATERIGAVPVADALAEANRRGGSFSGADLVWVRSATKSGAVYLLPYWRAFGTNAQGAAVARYVPALTK